MHKNSEKGVGSRVSGVGSDGGYPIPDTRRPTPCKPVAAVLLAEVKLTIGLTDEDGMPAGPFNVNPTMISRQDPEKRGRSIEQQFADLCQRAAARAIEEWENQRGS